MEQKISVIIPVYNAEKYIEKCILSLFKQEYENLEIIIINDCSTDNSFEIMKKYSEKINIINLENNGGVSHARNVGIKNATGDYLIFVDADDYIPEGTIKYMYDLLNKNDADIVCGSFEKSESEKLIFIEKDKIYKMLNCILSNKQFEFDINSLGFVHCKMYKKTILKNIEFDEKIRFREDTLFNIKAYSQCQKIICTSRQCYFYEPNANSASFKFFNNYINEINNFFDILYSYQKKGKITDDSINICGMYMYMNYLKHYAMHKDLKGISHFEAIKETYNQESWKEKFSKVNVSLLDYKYKILFFLYKYKLTFLIYLLYKLNQRRK